MRLWITFLMHVELGGTTHCAHGAHSPTQYPHARYEDRYPHLFLVSLFYGSERYVGASLDAIGRVPRPSRAVLGLGIPLRTY